MADTTKVSNAAANAEADAFSDLLDGGFLDIYDSTGGTGQPATVNTAIGSQVKLASLGFGSPSAPAASNGVLTFNAISSDISADATGTATWFRAFKSDHTTAIWDGSVGTSGATLNLNAVAIAAGAQVDCTSLTFTVNKG
jgi:hypothetical protein